MGGHRAPTAGTRSRWGVLLAACAALASLPRALASSSPCDRSGQGIGPASRCLLGSTASANATAQQAVFQWGSLDGSVPRDLLAPSTARVVSVGAGVDFAVVLLSDGTLTWFGYPWWDLAQDPTPRLTGVKAVAVGVYHVLALLGNGTVVGFGLEQEAPRRAWVVPARLQGATAVAAGFDQSAALVDGGRGVELWGDGAWEVPRHVQQALNEVRATRVALTSLGVALLLRNGTVACFGGTSNVDLVVPAGARAGVVELSCGRYHCLALRADGRVVGFGLDTYGQATPPAGLRGVAQVAAGLYHSLALLKGGGVVTWGSSAGGLGEVPATATARVLAVAGGWRFSVAVRDPSAGPGQFVVWGDTSWVEFTPSDLGQRPVTITRVCAGDRYAAALRSDGVLRTWGVRWWGDAEPTRTLRTVRSMSCGTYHVLALLTSGLLVGFGHPRNSTRAAWALPLDSLRRVVQTADTVAAGLNASVLLRDNGATLLPWGSRALGDVPSVIDLAVRFVGVEDVAVGGEYAVLLLLKNGTVVAFGDRRNGQLSVPPAARSNVRAIAAGRYHALALRTDSTVVAWGADSHGQVTPPPEALRGVVRIAAGAYHSMAVREDGRLVVWGDAASGVTDVPDLARPGGVVEAAGGWGVAVAVRDPAAGSHVVVAEPPLPPSPPGQPPSPPASPPPFSPPAASYWYATIFGSSAANQNATSVPPELGFLTDRGVFKDPQLIPSSVAIGYDGQFALALPNGSAYAWHRPPPAAASARPWFSNLPWLRDARVRQVAVGASVGVALLSNGSVRAWRYGDRGAEPLEVPSQAQSNVASVSCVVDEQAAMVVAVRSNGRTAVWEYALPFWTPVALAALEREDVGVYAAVLRVGAKKVVAGRHARLALLTDGSVVTWAPGGDPYGQTRLPAEARGDDILDVGAGVGHFVALRQDGRLVAWGLNADGQAAVPRDQGRGFYSLAVGWRHTLAISNNGSQPFAVGRKGVALVPEDLTRVTSVEAGSHQSIAIVIALFG